MRATFCGLARGPPPAGQDVVSWRLFDEIPMFTSAGRAVPDEARAVR